MSISITIDPNMKLGEIKALNGGCLAPPISSENAGLDIRKEFAALHLPITRLHDAPLDNRGLNLVDVPMIFPLFHADADDPRNYNFRATDDYIANCIACGTKVYYRLGVSIDHSYNKYVIEPPQDVAHWIDIVSHIIRHYNEGWANGFHYNIEYWEIWNEAEGISSQNQRLRTMWNAPVETYYDFYLQVSKELKSRFPHLKIGGPSNCQWTKRDDREYGKEFIDYCAEHNAPLDFYGFHAYANDPDWINQLLVEVRSYLDSRNFTNTELHLTEWAYMPHNGFRRMREDKSLAADIYARMKGLDAAAFIAYSLCSWQDLPVDMAHYYTVSTMGFGLFHPFSYLPAKAYYGLKAFGVLMHSFPHRIDIAVDGLDSEGLASESGNNEFGFNALSGCNDKGNIGVLVSNYRYGEQSITFRLKSAASFRRAKVFMLDHEHDLTPILTIDHPGGDITVTSVSESSVLLLEFEK